MKLTKCEYNNLILKHPNLAPTIKTNCDSHQRLGACAELQKLKDDIKGKIDNQPKEAKMDDIGHPQYKITIDVLYSDGRRRDLDGAASTLLDCTVHAVREIR